MTYEEFKRLAFAYGAECIKREEGLPDSGEPLAALVTAFEAEQAKIARLRAALSAIADGDGANECAHDWPEFYESVKRQARVALDESVGAACELGIDPHADTERHPIDHGSRTVSHSNE